MLNLNILEVLEDIDPTTSGPRVRLRVRELKPRSLLVNLKNCNAAQLSLIKANVGGIMSLPAQEMIFNGRFMLSIPLTEEDFFVIKSPETVPVSRFVELSPSDATETVTESSETVTESSETVIPSTDKPVDKSHRQGMR